MLFLNVLAGSLGALSVVFLVIGAAIDLEADKKLGRKAAAFVIMAMVTMLSAGVTMYFSERNLEKRNELTRKDYIGIVYYKYKLHETHKHSCEIVNRMIVKLPNNETIHVKRVNYVTFCKYKVGDKICFNLTDEDVIKIHK